VFCLDAETGQRLWHNELRGLGRGYVTFASSDISTVASDATAEAVTQAASSSS
jgi:hypothetical protein